MTETDSDDLLGELRRLAARFPLPHPLWHRYVGAMYMVIADFSAAVEAIEELPSARDELARRVDAGQPRTPAEAGGPQLAAARARLRELPIPQGEHPYIDEILLTLEAADTVLATLASVRDGDTTFTRASARIAESLTDD